MGDLLAFYRDSRLFLRRSAIAAGFTDAEIRRELQSGNLRRLYTGVYSPAVHEPDRFKRQYEEYVRSVLAHAHQMPHAIVSHASAAALYGLPLNQRLMERVHLTRVGAGGAKLRAGFQLHAGSVAACDVHVVPQSLDPRRAIDVRLTSPALSVIDTARSGPYESCVALADAALHQELVTQEELVSAVGHYGRRPGMSRVRRVLCAADGRSESVGESVMRLRFAAAGLPPLSLQVKVESSEGRVLARCDGAYIEYGVLFEFDGSVKYTTLLNPGESATDALLREKSREQALLEAGFILVRFVWRDLIDLRALRQRVEHAVERGRRAVAAGLVTGRCTALRPVTVEL